jgi:hypothetical protein
LTGGLRHANAMLPAARVARERQIETVYVLAKDAPEAAIVQGVRVIPVCRDPAAMLFWFPYRVASGAPNHLSQPPVF